MPIRCVRLTVIVALAAGGHLSGAEEVSTPIQFELLPGASLQHDSPTRSYAPVPLVGSFTLHLKQSAGAVWGEMTDLSLQSSSGEPHTLTGAGIYGESTDPRRNPLAHPINSVNFRLTVSVNGGADIQLLPWGDFPGTEGRFPTLQVWCFQDGIFGSPEESFDLFLKARPTLESLKLFFRRGDVTGDGERNITDAVVLLEQLFRGGESPTCLDAADANDDGRLDLADAAAILAHLFQGGGLFPTPGTFCGVDETDDGLGCEGQTACSAG